jgi:hypothetical protein
MYKWLITWTLLLVTGFFEPVKATHIVGGEMTYVCLGPVSSSVTRYQVRLDIYQDCLNGDPGAIAQDNPAILKVFTASGLSVRYDSIFISSSLIIPAEFSNSCLNNPPPTCLRKATVRMTYDLPNNSGYIIVYQKCCRNESIVNLVNPGDVGATYFCIIPPVTAQASCNNSAVFKNYPPQIICINTPLAYDHSAYDPDGDSLSYEFCQTYRGGSIADPKPIPTAPPYSTVAYQGGFSALKPMAGSPLVSINPVTGLINGTPNIEGRFVVTVCCNEWRNGQIINTVKREFQFVVTNCSKAVVANIPQYSEEFNTYIVECKNFTIHFDNLSTGGFDYLWDFGLPGNADTSTAFEPTFTYPDTGLYVVKLLVNKGSTCPDSITRLVKVFPTFTGYFNYSGLPCPNAPIEFRDSSQGTLNIADYWSWDPVFSTLFMHIVRGAPIMWCLFRKTPGAALTPSGRTCSSKHLCLSLVMTP